MGGECGRLGGFCTLVSKALDAWLCTVLCLVLPMKNPAHIAPNQPTSLKHKGSARLIENNQARMLVGILGVGGAHTKEGPGSKLEINQARMLIWGFGREKRTADRKACSRASTSSLASSARGGAPHSSRVLSNLRRRRDRHSAAPPSPLSRRCNTDGEGVSAECQVSPTAGRTSASPPA